MTIGATALADRFAFSIGFLLNALAAEMRRRGIRGPLEAAILLRIFVLWKRLRVVLAKWRDGTLRPPRPRVAREGAAPERPPRPPSLLPRGRGWLKRLLPDIAHHMNALLHPLTDPELAEIVAKAPQVGRILRPLWHLLGLHPMPEWLKLPKRARGPRPARVRKVAPSPPARAVHPLSRGAGDWAAERTNRGGGVSSRPIDVTRLSSVAYGNLIRPECDAHPTGLRPPNRIGYARPRGPPKNRG